MKSKLILIMILCLNVGVTHFHVYANEPIQQTYREIAVVEPVIKPTEIPVTINKVSSSGMKHNDATKEELTEEVKETKTEAIKEVEIESEEETKQNYNRWNIELDEDEQELLARITMLEAGNQSSKGQQAVVEVILNRVYDKDFPDTVEGVLSQNDPVQFVTYKNRNSSKAQPTEQVYESVKAVLNDETNILPFNTVYFSRGGEKGKKVQEVIEDHVFCNK